MPTRTVTADLRCRSTTATRGPRARGLAPCRPYRSRHACGPGHSKAARATLVTHWNGPLQGPAASLRAVGCTRVLLLLREHVLRDDGLGVGDAEVLGPFVGHRQQAPDAAGHGVLGHRRVGALAELLQRGLPVLEPEPAG